MAKEEKNQLKETGEKVAREIHRRPLKSKQMGLQVQPGDNSKFTAHTMQVFALPKIDRKDAEAVMNRSMEYFQMCSDHDMKPSVAEYALALGMDRMDLWRYCNGQHLSSVTPESVAVMKNFYRALNAQMENYMQNGKINPVSGIFLMKNNMGYADKTEVEVEAKAPIEQQKDIKQLEESYIESVAEDVE